MTLGTLPLRRRRSRAGGRRLTGAGPVSPGAGRACARCAGHTSHSRVVRADRGGLPGHHGARAVGGTVIWRGLHLDPCRRNADGAWREEIVAVVVTYEQVASAPDLFRPPPGEAGLAFLRNKLD